MRKRNGANTPQSIEAGLASAMHRMQDGLVQQYQQCEESVRRSPGSALVVASLAGFLMRSVPLGAVIGGLLRVVGALLRPALFLYVAAKIYDYVQRQAAASVPTEREPSLTVE